MRTFFAALLLAAIAPACFAQQPQTQSAPLVGVNAQTVNGVGPGYAPTAGSGLTLTLGGGTAFCNGAVVSYSSGTLTMTASATNYVYLNSSSSCAPAVKTSAMTASDIPIAAVVTSASAITSISDLRTPFVYTPSAGVTWPASGDIVVSTGGGAPSGVAEVDGDCVVGSSGAWAAGSCGGNATTVDGGALPASASFVGTNSSKQLVAATTTTLQAFLSTLTGCATAGYSYVPADDKCEATSGGGASVPLVPTVIDTTTPVTVSATNNAEFHFNENATAATAVTYDLPTAAAGKQFCFSNAYNGTAANTGTLTLQTSAAGQYIIFTDGTLSASDGYVVSGGAASDAGCVAGVDSTHWQLYVQRGTWTKH